MEKVQLSHDEIEKLHGVLDLFITQKTSIALSSLLGEPIKHCVVIKNSHAFEIENNYNNPGEFLLCSIFLKGEGEIRVGILYTVKVEDAKKMAAKLLCTDKIECLNELAKSSIAEVGNIMSGSFFNALSEQTGLKIDLSTPGFAITSITEFLHPHAAEFINPSDDIVSYVELEGVNSGLKLKMHIIQNSENAKKLLTSKTRMI